MEQELYRERHWAARDPKQWAGYAAVFVFVIAVPIASSWLLFHDLATGISVALIMAIAAVQATFTEVRLTGNLLEVRKGVLPTTRIPLSAIRSVRVRALVPAAMLQTMRRSPPAEVASLGRVLRFTVRRRRRLPLDFTVHTNGAQLADLLDSMMPPEVTRKGRWPGLAVPAAP